MKEMQMTGKCCQRRSIHPLPWINKSHWNCKGFFLQSDYVTEILWACPLVYPTVFPTSRGKSVFLISMQGRWAVVEGWLLAAPPQIPSINSVKIIQTSLVTKTDSLPAARLCLLKEFCTAPYLDMNSNKVCLKMWWYSNSKFAKHAILILTNLLLVTPQRPVGLMRKALFWTPLTENAESRILSLFPLPNILDLLKGSNYLFTCAYTVKLPRYAAWRNLCRKLIHSNEA